MASPATSSVEQAGHPAVAVAERVDLPEDVEHPRRPDHRWRGRVGRHRHRLLEPRPAPVGAAATCRPRGGSRELHRPDHPGVHLVGVVHPALGEGVQHVRGLGEERRRRVDPQGDHGQAAVDVAVAGGRPVQAGPLRRDRNDRGTGRGRASGRPGGWAGRWRWRPPWCGGRAGSSAGPRPDGRRRGPRPRRAWASACRSSSSGPRSGTAARPALITRRTRTRDPPG